MSEYIDSKEMVCRKSDCRRESLGSRVSATCKVQVMSGIEVISDVYEAIPMYMRDLDKAMSMYMRDLDCEYECVV